VGSGAQPGGERPVVSVVIPVYNSLATIDATLQGVAAQSLGRPYEVIAVDGGSTDGTRERLLAAGPAVTVLHNPEREPASSRNLGAASARADVIAFTDSDCAPEPEWLEEGLRALDGADIVQGRVIPLPGQGPFDRSLAVSGEYGLYETANLFVRREVFQRAGGFQLVPGLDLRLGTHFGEDAYFVWRAKRQGARTTFASEAIVRHAVFPRGIEGVLRETVRRRYFPQLVREIPELRRHFLYRGVFLGPGALRADLAAVGLLAAAASRRPQALLLVLPYGAGRWREARGYPRRVRPRLLAGRVAEDGVGLVAVLWGSLRARTLVL
jgi:glycosyltransferase involved in cell wall biosynthesis